MSIQPNKTKPDNYLNSAQLFAESLQPRERYRILAFANAGFRPSAFYALSIGFCAAQ